MPGLFAISVGTRAGMTLSSTPLQELATMGLCAAGLLLLAVAAYLVRKCPDELKARSRE